MYMEILHHSMTSLANHSNLAYWDYTGGNVVSSGIILHQLDNIPMVQHALKDLN